jgi:hypothetical protein
LAGDTQVNASDEILTRNNPKTFVNPATLTTAYDFNRDGFVNAADQILARSSVTSPNNTLRLLVAPGANLAPLSGANQMFVAQEDQAVAFALSATHALTTQSAPPSELQRLEVEQAKAAVWEQWPGQSEEFAAREFETFEVPASDPLLDELFVADLSGV